MEKAAFGVKQLKRQQCVIVYGYDKEMVRSNPTLEQIGLYPSGQSVPITS